MRRSRGFTLIETMVALTIMSFVITGISLLYLNGYRSYVAERDRIEVQENLRIAASRMINTIKQADPTDSNNIVISQDGKKIEFKLSSSKLWTGYRFDEVDKELEERIEGTSTWLPIASYVTDLVFTKKRDNIIMVTLKLQKGQCDEVQFNTEVNLRVGESG